MLFSKGCMNRVARVLLAMAAAGLLLVGAAIGYLAIESHAPIVLPAPTGPFAVGRVSYDWIDSARQDGLAPHAGVYRELLVWLWYPAEHPSGARPASYLPQKWAQAREDDRGMLGNLLSQSYTSVQVHAIEQAPISSRLARYPVLIFEPGLGNLPTDSTTIIEDLVSHGYIVAGITPTYSASVVAFPDGRIVKATPAGKVEGPAYDTRAAADAALNQLVQVWAGDAIFVMNRLTSLNADRASMFAGRLDLSRLGLFGHSFGGATAAEVCHMDARCKAGIDLDGTPFGDVVKDGLSRPFMFIQHDVSNCTSQDCNELTTMRSMLRNVPSGEGYILSVKGTQHFNFTDNAVFFSPLRLFGLLGPIDGRRGLQITATYVRAFFDAYLNHIDSPLLHGPSVAYPEVQRER